MTLKEYIQKARDPANWTPAFFETTEPIFIEHLSTIRRTLVNDELWDRFDAARCEWKLPGQAQVQESERRENALNRKVQEKKPLLISLSDVEEKEAEWLVEQYMPKGQINILAGDGGSGKTTSWCGLAAAISNGTKAFFDVAVANENPFVPREPQKVMFFSSEDSLEYTLKARLRKAGANLDNIYSASITNIKLLIV